VKPFLAALEADTFVWPDFGQLRTFWRVSIWVEPICGSGFFECGLYRYYDGMDTGVFLVSMMAMYRSVHKASMMGMDIWVYMASAIGVDSDVY
jgi:hypothetical protein